MASRELSGMSAASSPSSHSPPGRIERGDRGGTGRRDGLCDGNGGCGGRGLLRMAGAIGGMGADSKMSHERGDVLAALSSPSSRCTSVGCVGSRRGDGAGAGGHIMALRARAKV